MRQRVVRRARMPGVRPQSPVASGEPRGTSPRTAARVPTTHGPLPRNAVASPSVKLDTAPDTPPWGQVLARYLLPDRFSSRPWSVTFPQTLDCHLTSAYAKLGVIVANREPGGAPRRATPAVWTRSRPPAPALDSRLAPRPPTAGRALDPGTGGSLCHGGAGTAISAVSGPADSPDRNTGSTGRKRGRRPLPGKDPS
jgi:hypothetical protein